MLSDVWEKKEKMVVLESRKKRREKYVIKIAMEDVESTLSTELLRRKDVNFKFTLSEINMILKESVNLFAGLQF